MCHSCVRCTALAAVRVGSLTLRLSSVRTRQGWVPLSVLASHMKHTRPSIEEIKTIVAENDKAKQQESLLSV